MAPELNLNPYESAYYFFAWALFYDFAVMPGDLSADELCKLAVEHDDRVIAYIESSREIPSLYSGRRSGRRSGQRVPDVHLSAR